MSTLGKCMRIGPGLPDTRYKKGMYGFLVPVEGYLVGIFAILAKTTTTQSVPLKAK